MTGDVVNVKVCRPPKLHSGLTGKYHVPMYIGTTTHTIYRSRFIWLST